jgi:hypothetical protein
MSNQNKLISLIKREIKSILNRLQKLQIKINLNKISKKTANKKPPFRGGMMKKKQGVI